MNYHKTTSEEPIKAYTYCPKCAGQFEPKGGNWLQCTSCKYNFFVNAAPAVGVLIFNNKNQVLLARRKFDPKKGTWQIPGGFMNPGEIPEKAIIREAEEELGVQIRVDRYVGCISETYLYGGVLLPFLGIYFTATIMEGTITPNDDVADAQFFDVEEMNKLDITYPALVPLIKRAVNISQL